MIYIGIDPGNGGGIAAVDVTGAGVWAVRMPETERDILDVLRGCQLASAVLEKVHSSPQMGVTSSFTFGRGYGGLRMALTACCIPFDEVTPQRWQKTMGCLTKGDKNVSKRRAQDLFPGIKVTHATADALLLALYCLRTRSAASELDVMLAEVEK